MISNRLRINNLQGDEPEFVRPINARTEFKSQGNSATLEIYDIISRWGASHKVIRDALKSTKAGNITVKINSPGGDVFEGLAIYNELKDHRATVHIEIVSLAASIASIIAMAGDTISIADNAFIMIHNSWTVAVGDTQEMMQTAEVLGKIDKGFQRTYAQRTGQSIKDIASMMDKETWLDAGDAVEKGFADRVSEKQTQASAQVFFDLSSFSNVPEAFATRAPRAKMVTYPDKPTHDTKQLGPIMSALEQLKGALRV